MEEIIVKLFILFVGFAIGFILAGSYALKAAAEKACLREELLKTKKELKKAKAEPAKTIEISDGTIGGEVDYSQLW